MLKSAVIVILTTTIFVLFILSRVVKKKFYFEMSFEYLAYSLSEDERVFSAPLINRRVLRENSIFNSVFNSVFIYNNNINNNNKKLTFYNIEFSL